MTSKNQVSPPSSTFFMSSSEAEATSAEQSPATTSPTSDGGNSSQTVADTTTTTTVSDSESTPSNSVSFSSTSSATNNDDSTSSFTSTDTTTVSISTSVASNSSPEIPTTSTTSESTIESTFTALTTVETTPTSTFTDSTTSESVNTNSTSVESPTTTSGEVDTTSTTAATTPTTVTRTTSETSTTVPGQPTTVTNTTSETSTTVTEQPTSVTGTTETSTTVPEQPTTVTNATSETSTTVTEQPTTVTSTGTTPETSTTVTEQPTTVTDATSGTSTTVIEQPTTVAGTTSETSTTVTEQPPTVTGSTSETSTTVSDSTSATNTDVSTTDASSSFETNTKSQTISGSPTETQTVTVTRTESETTTQTETVTLTQTTQSSSSTQSGSSASIPQSGLSSGSGSTAAGPTTDSLRASAPTSLVLLVSTDTLTDVNTSNLDVLTQNSLPTAQALSLSSIGVTYVTTDFSTSTLPNGQLTSIPTRTRTVTGTGNATYTLQPNDFERNKGAVVGVIVAASFLAAIGIFVGICLCRRRRQRVAGRRDTLTPFGDVTTGRVLIPGHPPLSGDRLINSQQWRPPLVGEVGEDEDDTATSRKVMSETRSAGGSILPVAYRDRPTTPPPRESVEVTSMTSSGQDSAMQFGTSLLSFDGPQQQDIGSRFSYSSSLEGGVRTASLISLSAEPTPIGSRFSNASSTSGAIPIISPFADSFSTQEAARNSYWASNRPSSPQSSLSGDRPIPKRSGSMGSQTSGRQQSVTTSEQGWKEIEIEDHVPRPSGRASAPTHTVVVSAANPFEMEATPSLMSQVSLLNPPVRPSFHTTLTELIHQSRPPVLPEIPVVASPALTEDSFHPEGLLADHAYAQSRSESNNASRASLHSLLDHVDYSRPIVESPRQSSSVDSDINFRLSRETGRTFEDREFESSENPFEDPVDEDLCNDVSPVLTMLQRSAYSKTSLVSTRT